MTTISVLLVEDHDVVRQGLRRLLEAEPDMRVVGEAENGRQSVEETRKLRPEVILMDLAMPQLNGLEATWQITASVPSSKVLILSSYSDESFVAQALEAGAAGYIIKQSAATEVCQGVREVHSGGTYFSPLVFRRVSNLWLHRYFRPGTKRLSGLTMREIEVLQLIAEGYATKQIAGVLSLSKKTIEKHRQTVMAKLDCHNIASVTRYAVKNGIVALNSTPFQTPNWPDDGTAFGQWGK